MKARLQQEVARLGQEIDKVKNEYEHEVERIEELKTRIALAKRTEAFSPRKRSTSLGDVQPAAEGSPPERQRMYSLRAPPRPLGGQQHDPLLVPPPSLKRHEVKNGFPSPNPNPLSLSAPNLPPPPPISSFDCDMPSPPTPRTIAKAPLPPPLVLPPLLKEGVMTQRDIETQFEEENSPSPSFDARRRCVTARPSSANSPDFPSSPNFNNSRMEDSDSRNLTLTRRFVANGREVTEVTERYWRARKKPLHFHCALESKEWPLGQSLPIYVTVNNQSPKVIKSLSIFLQTTKTIPRAGKKKPKSVEMRTGKEQEFDADGAFPLKPESTFQGEIRYEMPDSLALGGSNCVHELICNLQVKGAKPIKAVLPITIQEKGTAE
ncbi:hypothetical protein QOT17_008300 [Balamuthia mandrillaris]